MMDGLTDGWLDGWTDGRIVFKKLTYVVAGTNKSKIYRVGGKLETLGHGLLLKFRGKISSMSRKSSFCF